MSTRLDLLGFRRHLRRASTDAERKIWWVLRRKHLGVKFRRQHPVGPYTLDFYCPGAKLCVELDGGSHYEEAGQARDAKRTRYLAERGIRVIRFSDREALLERDLVLEVIWEAIHGKAASFPPPSPRPSPPAARGEREDGLPRQRSPSRPHRP